MILKANGLALDTVTRSASAFCAVFGFGLLTALPHAQSQSTTRKDTCVELRAPETGLLLNAMAVKKPEDIAQALSALSLLPRFALPQDPTSGRRPVRGSYAVRFTDRQLNRRAVSFINAVEKRGSWRAVKASGSAVRGVSPARVAGTIRSLLVLAQAFPELAIRARKLARDMGDAILIASEQVDISAVPIALASLDRSHNPFMRATVRQMLSTCRPLKQVTGSGWFVAAKAPELHYADTARVGEAFIALTRDTGEQRFLAWTRNASAWYSRHPFVADIHANAMAAGLDAELFTLSAEEKYLNRAVDRARFGVLPAFDALPGSPNSIPFVRRLPLGDLANILHALVQISTALAAAPVGMIDEDILGRINLATRYAYRSLRMRALKGRRLQLPVEQIELAFDIERAQRAGAALVPPDVNDDAFRHVLAHGVDRLKRYIPMDGAASGLLLARLKERGWAGAYRTAKPAAGSTKAVAQ